jgi:hypothetical protein
MACCQIGMNGSILVAIGAAWSVAWCSAESGSEGLAVWVIDAAVVWRCCGCGRGRMEVQAGAWWFMWMVVGGAAIVGGTPGAARLLTPGAARLLLTAVNLLQRQSHERTKVQKNKTQFGCDGWGVAGGNFGVVVNGEGSEGKQTGAGGQCSGGRWRCISGATGGGRHAGRSGVSSAVT